MNILVITKEYNPSTSTDSKRFTGICNYFAEQGHFVTVLCDTKNAFPTHKNIEVVTLKKIGKSSSGMFERLLSHSTFMFQSYLKGRKVKSVDVVIVTSPPPFSMISGKKLSKKFNAKYVLDLRDIWPDVFVQTQTAKETGLIYKIFKFIVEKSYKKADLISVVTPGKKILLENKYPDYASKIKWISNGFNKEILEHDIDQSLAEHFLGNINVVYTGKIGIAQDLTNLIKLAEDYDYKDYLVFHLFGSGRDEEAIKKMIEEKDLKNVKFYGYRSEKEITTALKLSQISYVSLGSDLLIDSIPTKMYESMLFGCSILLSAKGDAVDLLEEFDFGKHSLPGDYESLKNNFEYLLSNHQIYKNRVDSVRKDLLSKYSRDVVSEKFLDEIDKIN